ncbi:MAG: hypothetical protein RBS35_00880 [Azonexus sp.]|jgi:hypothetical protein|nr:hypothetical protein [Azonexus sp.]
MKTDRQLPALLHACGLQHWQDTLTEWLEDYEPLEHVVDNDEDQPRASVLGLLRLMAKMHSKPSDNEFAAMLSELEFLNYRILRTPAGERPSIANAEAWDPTSSNLRDFLHDSAYQPAGYPSPKVQLNRDEVYKRLLRLLHKHQRHG